MSLSSQSFILPQIFPLVGFGNYEPTRISTKILLFPLALLGIAQLGSILGMIIEFFSLRAAKRKAQSRALLERERQVEQDKKQAPPNLLQEIEFLVEMNNLLPHPQTMIH